MEAARQVYGAELTKPPKRHSARPRGWTLVSHGFRAKDAGLPTE